MEKDEAVNGGQESSEEASKVVLARRRRAPGVVIGDEAADGGQVSEPVPVSGEKEVAPPPTPATGKSEEKREDAGSDTNLTKPRRGESAGKRRSESQQTSEIKEGEGRGEAQSASSPAASADETSEGNESQTEAEKVDEPARKRRRSRRSGAAKPAAEERPVMDVGGLDPEELSTKSWELFCREIQENGMEIVDDREARKFAVRAVEIAKIYLQERARLIVAS